MINNTKEFLRYFVIGIMTVFINILVYSFLSYFLNFSTLYSTVGSWLISVIFAYLGNKFIVFHSVTHSMEKILYEFFSFVLLRLFSGIIDLAIMLLFVDYLLCDEIMIKLGSNFIVIIVNYLTGKFITFNNKKNIN